MECDYQHLADQRGTVIHIPVSVRLGEGYGKLADWVYDSSDATLAATSRSHVGYPDDTVGLYDKRSRGLAIRDAAHAVDLDWRPIRFRQNILALFRIPASDPYRAAKLHEHQYSGFDDNETIGIIEGYGKLLCCYPAAVRRGVGGFRVAKHLHLPITHDKQAETAGRERYDALVGEWTERFWDGLIRRRVVLLSTAGELDVAVDRDCASDPTQREAVVRIRRFPRLGYGKLFSRSTPVVAMLAACP